MVFGYPKYNQVMGQEILQSLEMLSNSDVPRVVSFTEADLLKGRVAVLPASFNPPTLAHLELLDLSKAVTGTHSAAAMLTTQNVSKIIHEESLRHRLAMLMAVRLTSDLHVLGCNKARIVDQALVLSATFPNCLFDFIVGFDTLIRFFDERFYDNSQSMTRELSVFFTGCRLITANRNDDDVNKVYKWIDDNSGSWKESIIVLELNETIRYVSSTIAREAIKEGRASTFLSPLVQDYITRNNLYRD